VQNYKI